MQVVEELVKTAEEKRAVGEVAVLGLTGQAGAGKTFLAGKILEGAESLGIRVQNLALDAFFKLSSRQRRLWLEEGDHVGGAERERRRNQINWWDFESLKSALRAIRSGQLLELTNVYNRADKGEKTGSVTVDLRSGGLLVLEGVAIAHLRPSGLIDHLVYVHADDDVRKVRLFGRDLDRRPDREAKEDRWRLTQHFETVVYFPECRRYADELIINNEEKRPERGSIESWLTDSAAR